MFSNNYKIIKKLDLKKMKYFFFKNYSIELKFSRHILSMIKKLCIFNFSSIGTFFALQQDFEVSIK